MTSRTIERQSVSKSIPSRRSFVLSTAKRWISPGRGGPYSCQRPSLQAAAREDRDDAAVVGGVLTRPDDVVVAEHRAIEAEDLVDHAAVRLAGQLADAVQRDRVLRAILDVPMARLAEDGAGRGVDELRHPMVRCPQQKA